jgi:hypothetical protein
MKPFDLPIMAALVLSGGAAHAIEPEPLSVVQALMDAEAATDLELALSLLSDDAVIINVTGARIAGAGLAPFIDADMRMRRDFPLEDVSVKSNRVAWSRSIDDPFYRDIGVAPIRFRLMADVSHGKITTIVALVSPDDIDRIDAACRQRPVEPRIYGRPCSEFVQLISAQAESAEPPSERPRHR